MNVRLLILPVLSLTLLACENKCLTLAKKVCECEDVASAVETCQDRAESEMASVDISAEQEALCASKIDLCACEGLDTPQGQINCGLANEPAAPNAP